MGFKIEKNIPAPKGRGRSSDYPLTDMKVGESFFVPREQASTVHVRNIACSHASRHSMKFTVRTVENGCRVWRVA